MHHANVSAARARDLLVEHKGSLRSIVGDLEDDRRRGGGNGRADRAPQNDEDDDHRHDDDEDEVSKPPRVGVAKGA
jgi:hypothetical protein